MLVHDREFTMSGSRADKFRNWFNNDRKIQKLGYKTPMQIMKEKQFVKKNLIKHINLFKH
jgi:hypothetical protein